MKKIIYKYWNKNSCIDELRNYPNRPLEDADNRKYIYKKKKIVVKLIVKYIVVFFEDVHFVTGKTARTMFCVMINNVQNKHLTWNGGDGYNLFNESIFHHISNTKFTMTTSKFQE